MKGQGSKTVHTEGLLEGVARTVDPCFYGGQGHALVLGDLRISEIAKFPEHQSHSEVFGEVLQCLLHHVSGRDFVGEVPIRGEGFRDLDVGAPPGAGDRQCCIGGNPVDPGPEAGLPSEPTDAAPGSEQRVLEGIFGIVGIPRDPQAYGPDHRPVLGSQRLKSAGIARDGGIDEQHTRPVCVQYFPQVGSGRSAPRTSR